MYVIMRYIPIFSIIFGIAIAITNPKHMNKIIGFLRISPYPIDGRGYGDTTINIINIRYMNKLSIINIRYMNKLSIINIRYINKRNIIHIEYINLKIIINKTSTYGEVLSWSAHCP